MTHIVDRMLDEAAQAVNGMREAAIAARRLHARAELMRHMRLTARKVMDRPVDEAVRFVTEEWMQAWGLGDDAYRGLAEPLRHYTEAFCRDARASSAATEAAIAAGLEELEGAFERIGTTLADEMAYRSGCAHGWWEMVVPVPEHARRDRPNIPRWQAGQPFWKTGAAPHCLAG